MKLSSVYTCPLLATLLQWSLAAGANTTSNDPVLLLSSDETFHFNLLIALGDAVAGGSDIAPVLGAAKNIQAGNMTSYSEVFYELANRTKAQAENPDNAYESVNVKDTWFSAANYFRRADFFIHENWSNPLINSLWEEQTAAFNNGLAALPIPGKRIRIPATKGNFTIEAIWYSASENENAKLPTLIIGNGLDAAQEDSYHNYVVPALARGWNCITYEGPGQPTVRREQNIGFIPDWERVVSPVVDYVLSEKSEVVDKDRLAIVGNSMGSYLAARAAAFEPRLSAVVLIDGAWDIYTSFAAPLPSEMLAIFEAGNYTQFDHELLSLRASGKLSTGAAWGLDEALWTFNTHSPSQLLLRSKKFELKDVVDQIKMPVFIGNGEYDTLMPGQAEALAKALGDRATLHNFTGVAGYHCQTGAGQEMSRSIFVWLNKTLG
ncbi:hypothetical protein DTO271G3_2347 [Paecilomyces variotii]|nr:hypothetical protein DTO271G3_2347 [Paecilomyces variotii]